MVMPRNIKLTLEYDGTNFQGWQAQAANHRTVQVEVQKSLEKFLFEKIIIFGSGRTDSGVHARGQVANFYTQSNLSTEKILKALNAHLPADIAALNVENVPSNFHAQYSVKSKAYRYSIFTRAVRPVVDRNFCLHFPYKLNFALMRRESKILLGRHDFKSFQAADRASEEGKARNSIRTVKRIDIVKKGGFLHIDIESTGFLYKMVRNIVGTLLEIGSGKFSAGSMKKILLAKDRFQAGDTVKPHGLYLMEVQY
jgi:tRNA pseudouridine38-40 synthase